MNILTWKFNILLILSIMLNPFNSRITALPNKHIASVHKTTKKLNRKDIEKQLGRKLVLKERLALWVINRKIRKDNKRQKSNSNLVNYALIFSLAGLIPFLGIFFALPGIILGIISLFKSKKSEKELKHRKRAWTAIIIGLLAIGWFFLLIWMAINRSQ